MKTLHIKVLYLIVLCAATTVNAQVDSIKLPKGEDEIKVNQFTPFVSIYVDSDNNVYLEKEPINVYDIAKKLSYIRYKMPIEAQIRTRVFLYIDNIADYYIIDEIKTQLASAYFERLYYKTNTVEDKDLLKGVYWTNHESFYHLNWPEKVLTKKEQERQKRFNDSISEEFGDIPPPPPPPPNWFFDSRHIIYSDSKDAIDEALENKTYTCVTLINKGYQKEAETINFEDKEKIEKLFYSKDVIFVRFSKDLKYENYFKAIKGYKNLNTEGRGFFFELSHEIIDIHKKSKIDLCD